MNLKYFICFSLLFISGHSFAAEYCITTPDSAEVNLSTIIIPPGAEVGEVVSRSIMTQKTTTCRNAPYSEVAYTDTSRNIPTNVYVDFPENPAGGAYSEKCEAMESGFPGLGIAWVNFNSGTKKWQCASINPAGKVTRGLPRNGEAIIYDQIILVKTGPIGDQSGKNETFDFNKVFQFNERKDSPNESYLPDNGKLYNLTLSGKTTIQAPICIASTVNDQFTVPTINAVDGMYTTDESGIVNIDCSGVIENGSIAKFKPISNNGVFSSDNQYFSTSEPSVGISVKYKTNESTTWNATNPEGYVDVPVFNNKATVKLKYTPYIKGGSGNYPLAEDVLFNLMLSNGNNHDI